MRNLKVLPQSGKASPVPGGQQAGQAVGVTMSWTPAGVTLGSVAYVVDEQPFTYGSGQVRLMRAGRP